MKRTDKERDPRFEELVYDQRYRKSKATQPRPDPRFAQAAQQFDDPLLPDRRGGHKKVKHSLRQELGLHAPEDLDEASPASSDAEDIDMAVVQRYLGAPEEEAPSVWSEHDDAPAFAGAARRLALQNYDWAKLRAGDLMITFCSFLPPGGRLERVTVYPSDFGLQKLRQEELEGPGDIFKPEDAAQEAPPAKAKQPRKAAAQAQKPRRQTDAAEWVAGDDAETGLDLNKLRRYERERLKYYYAVLDFDSPATADAVFEACNGYELEKTGIKVDLRAVPDDLDFPHPPKETCTEKPSQATALNFLNRALTHTSVTCTWDEPDRDNKRNELLFKDGIADQLDLDDYIAPGIEEPVYDTDDDAAPQLAEDSPLEQSAASKSEERAEPAQPRIERVNIHDDFDKQKKKRGIKISFKNPLEVKGALEDDNPLGKRVFSIKHARKELLPDDQEDEAADFFEPLAAPDAPARPPAHPRKPVKDEALKNLKFKERMREKKRQAKLEKERSRTERQLEKQQRQARQQQQTEDLALLAGEKKLKGAFEPDLRDSRFPLFADPDLAVDPTSAAFDKKKHARLLAAKKEISQPRN